MDPEVHFFQAAGRRTLELVPIFQSLGGDVERQGFCAPDFKAQHRRTGMPARHRADGENGEGTGLLAFKGERPDHDIGSRGESTRSAADIVRRRVQPIGDVRIQSLEFEVAVAFGRDRDGCERRHAAAGVWRARVGGFDRIVAGRGGEGVHDAGPDALVEHRRAQHRAAIVVQAHTMSPGFFPHCLSKVNHADRRWEYVFFGWRRRTSFVPTARAVVAFSSSFWGRRRNRWVDTRKRADKRRVASEVCLKEIPKSGAQSAGTSDCVAYFSGLDCYQDWAAAQTKEETMEAGES
jgi:hypothetical protein